MKVDATTLPIAAAERSTFAIWSDLVKARLTFLVLLTTLGALGGAGIYWVARPKTPATEPIRAG